MIATVLTIVAGCDLPQDGNNTQSDATGDTTGGGTYKFIRLVDQDGAAESTMPGADIDAIVVFSDGAFVSAGCADASLFGESEVHIDNGNVDLVGATLGVREDSEAGGFVSLGAGTLLCELPVAVKAPGIVTIFEVEADKADAYEVVFAEDLGDGDTFSAGVFTGSADIDVP